MRRSIETNLTSDDFKSDEDYVPEEENSGTCEGSGTTEDTSDFVEVFDAFGNALTETIFADGEIGTIYRAFGFTPNCNGAENAGNDLVSETDARGNATCYTVDEETARNEEVVDRCGNKTAYEYDADGKITKVISNITIPICKPHDMKRSNIGMTKILLIHATSFQPSGTNSLRCNLSALSTSLS